MTRIVLLFLIITVFITFANAFIIYIPEDQPTIQAGIDVAANSDTLLVQPGTYLENIDFNGKSITVASYYIIFQDSFYIEQTKIDGDHNGSVVIFDNNENTSSILAGFSIVHGSGTYFDPVGFGDFYWGGGIFCINSDPT